MPYDIPIMGFRSGTANTLRIWSARSPQYFDMNYFGQGDYIRASAEKELAETISRVLYPNDSHNAGKSLRLQQQYTLQESYITETGERVRAIHYVADFAYERPTAPDKYGTVFWLPVVEDVKSRATKTAQYEMKKKLLRERFNLTITEV